MTHDDDAAARPRVEQHPVGPGFDQNPTAPFLREGPRRAPASVRTLLLEGLPFLVLVGVVLLVVSR